MEKYTQSMQKAAYAAGKIIKDAFYRDFQIDEKERKEGVSDFVTTIDKASDALIIKILNKECPNIPVITEESGGKRADKYFLVDPLDGTTNFISGIDYIAVSIAYIENESIKAGCIYDPIRDNLFLAEKGKGAFLNQKRLQISDTPLNRSILIQEENFGGTRQKQILNRTALLTPEIAGLRKTGSTALDLAYLGSGKPWILLATALKPWDVAGGAIIASEAGVKLTTIQGEKFSLKSESILAASPKTHTIMLNKLLSAKKMDINSITSRKDEIKMKDIILDCDPGQDDALAILLALGSKNINLKAITVVGGNANVDKCYRNALKVLGLANRLDIPVYLGAEKPLKKELTTLEDVFGLCGMAGTEEWKVPNIPPQKERASDFLATTFSINNQLNLCAIAPQTNIALALQKNPQIAQNISSLTVMGGCVFPEPIRGRMGNFLVDGEYAEYNLGVDPLAADIVLKSGIKQINMIGLNVTKKVLYDEKIDAKLREMNSKITLATADMLSTVGNDDLIDYALLKKNPQILSERFTMRSRCVIYKINQYFLLKIYLLK